MGRRAPPRPRRPATVPAPPPTYSARRPSPTIPSDPPPTQGSRPKRRSPVAGAPRRAARCAPTQPAPSPAAPLPRPRTRRTPPPRTTKPPPASPKAAGARTRCSARSPRAPRRTDPWSARTRRPLRPRGTRGAGHDPRTPRRSRARACDRLRAGQRLAPPDASPEADQLAQRTRGEPHERRHVDGRAPRAARQVADLDLAHAPAAHGGPDRDQQRRRDRAGRDVAAQVVPHLAADQLERDVHVAQPPAAGEPRRHASEGAHGGAGAGPPAPAPGPPHEGGPLPPRPQNPHPSPPPPAARG